MCMWEPVPSDIHAGKEGIRTLHAYLRGGVSLILKDIPAGSSVIQNNQTT